MTVDLLSLISHYTQNNLVIFLNKWLTKDHSSAISLMKVEQVNPNIIVSIQLAGVIPKQSIKIKAKPVRVEKGNNIQESNCYRKFLSILYLPIVK